MHSKIKARGLSEPFIVCKLLGCEVSGGGSKREGGEREDGYVPCYCRIIGLWPVTTGPQGWAPNCPVLGHLWVES
jgi:hypothetical protein